MMMLYAMKSSCSKFPNWIVTDQLQTKVGVLKVGLHKVFMSLGLLDRSHILLEGYKASSNSSTPTSFPSCSGGQAS